MTEEQQRIVIAETHMGCQFEVHENSIAKWWIRIVGGGFAQAEAPPDYLHDLNAMHEAEKVLTLRQRGQFVHILDTMFDDENCIDWPIVHAAAAQRAEAFLKCLGKWTET